MKLKPYKYRGRFYNHPNDSIKAHFASLLRTGVAIIKDIVTRKDKKKDFFKAAFKLDEWVETTKPLDSSVEPVVTWIGHATFLIQIGGVNIITDPIFFDFTRFCPRMIRSAFSFDQLPKIDIVLISHNHIDHMDKRSLLMLKKYQPLILVPLGDRSWFDGQGFLHVKEKNWWDKEVYGKYTGLDSIVCSFLPASHWAGRSLLDWNKSLWGSWMIECNGFSIYFGGDTTYTSHFRAISKYYPSIHVALLPIGPNEPRITMKDSHISFEEAIKAFVELKARHFIPMHWGTFKQGVDGFHKPIRHLRVLWEKSKAYLHKKQLHIVKFGEGKKFDMR